jgi:predicted short-subunit dehydrogenase-like oxidoreductase (DUF2520 family)
VERLVFLGPGRVGLALGYALAQADAAASITYFGRHEDPPVHPIFSQRLAEYRYGIEPPPPGTTAVFLTVPDRALGEMAMALAARGEAPGGCAAFHCSGALGADPLEPLHRVGYAVGTFHPLQAVANPVVGAERLMGATFALSGDSEALMVARRLVSALGGHGLQVPTAHRPLYHAAAVMASNYVVVLLGEAARLLMAAGASREEAERGLASLARGVLEDVGELGSAGALTGPVQRGDLETVGLHLRVLEERDRELYALLGRRALDRVRNELEPEVVAGLERLFEAERA